MNLFITGGTGYVGYSLIRCLQQAKGIDRITVYDNLSRKNYAFFHGSKIRDMNIRFVEGELLDERKLKREMSGADCLVHLAAKVTTPYADQEAHQFDQVNHWGTSILCSVAQEVGIKRMVYLSSMAVYGRSEKAVSEEDDTHPFSFYGISKLNAERQLMRIANEAELYILRSGNVYGYNPALRIDAVINKFMYDAQFNGRVSIFGNGHQQRAFIHVGKLAKTIGNCLIGRIPADTYNVCEHNFSINQVVAYLKHLYPDLETIAVNPGQIMPQISAKKPSKLENILPFEQVSFSDELEDFRSHFAF